MEITIKYLFLDVEPEERKRDEEALARFPEIVAQRIPGFNCKTKLAESEIEQMYLHVLKSASTFKELARTDEWILSTTTLSSGLVVLCSEKSKTANLARASVPTAEWGVTSGFLSAVFHHDRFTVWHEMLHLLDADDCYDPDSPEDEMPTCGNRRCIMQYAPTEKTAGEPVFLCEENIMRVRRIFHLE